MSVPDYATMGFTLDANAVRKQLRLSRVGEVYDLVRSGELSALNTLDPGTRERELLFHPAEIAAYVERWAANQTVIGERLTAKAYDVLNEYLMAFDPVEDYDEALASGRPLLGAHREGDPAVFVRVKAIRDWFNHSDAVQMGVTTSIISDTLERMLATIGAVRARGILAQADRGTKKQRWAYWWRLPDKLFTDELPDPAPTDRRDGEAMARSGGVTHLAQTLTSRSTSG